jgi:hypothetical protein
MSFSKSRISRDEQSESLVDVPVKPSSSLGRILKTSSLDQGQDKVMYTP